MIREGLKNIKNKVDELITTSHALHEFKNQFKTVPWISPIGDYLVREGYLEPAKQGIIYATETKRKRIDGHLATIPVKMESGHAHFYRESPKFRKHKKLLKPLLNFENPIDFQKAHNYRPSLPVKLE